MICTRILYSSILILLFSWKYYIIDSLKVMLLNWLYYLVKFSDFNFMIFVERIWAWWWSAWIAPFWLASRWIQYRQYSKINLHRKRWARRGVKIVHIILAVQHKCCERVWCFFAHRDWKACSLFRCQRRSSRYRCSHKLEASQGTSLAVRVNCDLHTWVAIF